MKVDQVRKEISYRFAERSKIAWALYEKEFAKKCEQYAPKYSKKDSE